MTEEQILRSVDMVIITIALCLTVTFNSLIWGIVFYYYRMVKKAFENGYVQTMLPGNAYPVWVKKE